jgi:hypothetical protein
VEMYLDADMGALFEAVRTGGVKARRGDGRDHFKS